MQTIALTGASGHLGNVICRLLLEKGYAVRALVYRDTQALEGLNVQHVKGNVMNPADLDTLVKGCDAVIHCAAIISITGDPTGEVLNTNSNCPALVMEACQRNHVKRMVHVSSVHAVSEIPGDTPYDETRPYKDKSASAYDYSKAQGEQNLIAAAKKGNTEYVIVRPAGLLGPFDFKGSEFGKALLDFYNRKIPALVPGGYNFADVRDAAASAIAAMEKGRPGEIYLLAGYYYTVKEIGLTVEKVTGKKAPRRMIPFWVLRFALPFVKLWAKITGGAPVFTRESIEALRHGHKNMVFEKAARELGHHPRRLEESVRDFFQWQKERGKIN